MNKRKPGEVIRTTLDESKQVREQKALRRDTAAAQRRFLAAYATTGIIQSAIDAADISRTTFFRWQAEDASFAAAVTQAYQAAADRLEQEARRRAEQGVCKPVLYHGKPVKIRNPKTKRLEPLYEHTYSDALMSKLLNGFKPDKYREAGDVRTTNIQVNVQRGPLPAWFGPTTDTDDTATPESPSILLPSHQTEYEEPRPKRRHVSTAQRTLSTIPALLPPPSGDSNPILNLVKASIDATT